MPASAAAISPAVVVKNDRRLASAQRSHSSLGSVLGRSILTVETLRDYGLTSICKERARQDDREPQDKAHDRSVAQLTPR
jgi:hypothetical protein